jgi:hypothetical protein
LLTSHIIKFTWHAKTFNLGKPIFSVKKTTWKLSGETAMVSYHCATTLYNQAATYISELFESEKKVIEVYYKRTFIIKIPKIHGTVLFNELTRKRNLLGNFTIFAEEILTLLAKSYWTMYCVMYEPSIVIQDQIKAKGLLPVSDNTHWHDYTIYAGIPLLLFQKIFVTSLVIRQSSSAILEKSYKGVPLDHLLLSNEMWTIRELVNVTFVIKLKMETEQVKNDEQYLDIDTEKKEIETKMNHLEKMKTSLDYSLRFHLCVATFLCVSIIRIQHTKIIAEKPDMLVNLYHLVEKVNQYMNSNANPLEANSKIGNSTIDILDYYMIKIMHRKINDQLEDLKICKPLTNPKETESVVDSWIDETNIMKKPYDFYEHVIKLHKKWTPFCKPEFTHEVYSDTIMNKARNDVLNNLFSPNE